MQQKGNGYRQGLASMDGFLKPIPKPAPVPRPPVTRLKPTSVKPTVIAPKKFIPPAKKHWYKKRPIVFGGVGVTLVCLMVGGWLGYKVLSNTSRVFGGSLRSNLASLVDAPVKLKGEDDGRVNILLAGVSSDDPGHQGGDLTDSVMLVSLNTKDHTAVMLSIPRDLWVNIPNYGGHSKINTMNHYGDVNGFSQAGYPNGGMGLLEKTVSRDFGIPINYYVKVNYTALKDAVNAVGGVDVNIESSDPRGLYDPNISKHDQGPLKLPTGVNHLNGQTALNLARARGDPTFDGRVAYGFTNSDFTRTQNQRLMLVALKDKALSTKILANPLKLGQLLDSVGNNVQTDLKLNEVKRLYTLGQSLGTGSKGVTSLSLSDDKNNVHLVSNYTAPDGSSALRPTAGVDDFSQIQLLIKKLTSNSAVVKESPTLLILNGSQVVGLAQRQGTILTGKGFAATMDNAPADSTKTFIIDNTKGKKPNSLKVLKTGYGSATQATAGYTATLPTTTADFIVVLGKDQATPAQ